MYYYLHLSIECTPSMKKQFLPAEEVDGGLLPPEEVEGEVVDEPPVEIFVHVAEAVALAGEDEHLTSSMRHPKIVLK